MNEIHTHATYLIHLILLRCMNEGLDEMEHHLGELRVEKEN